MVADLRRAPGLSVVLPTASCQANKRTYQRTSKQREAPSRQQTNIPTHKQTARSALKPLEVLPPKLRHLRVEVDAGHASIDAVVFVGVDHVFKVLVVLDQLLR